VNELNISHGLMENAQNYYNTEINLNCSGSGI